jgi:multidrug efflux pump subunit AcrA (membrane-fusion protein)
VKKYFWLIFCSIGILSILFFINKSEDKNIPKVKTKKLKIEEVTESIKADGYIKSENATEIRYALPIYINEMYVSEGDYVETGDKIFSVNKEKTVDFLINGGYLNTASMPDIDYSLITALPSEITTPNSGYVSNIAYSKGNLYDMLNPIMTISKKDDYCAVLQISETNLSKVKVGQKVKLKCNAITSEKFEGEISKIDNHAEQVITDSPSIERVVKIYVNNIKSKIKLKNGFSVQGNIILDKSKKVIAPYSCILQDGGGEYLYLIKNGYIEKVYIKTNGDYLKGSAVSNALKDSMVVENPEKLKGDKIKIYYD